MKTRIYAAPAVKGLNKAGIMLAPAAHVIISPEQNLLFFMIAAYVLLSVVVIIPPPPLCQSDSSHVWHVLLVCFNHLILHLLVTLLFEKIYFPLAASKYI